MKAISKYKFSPKNLFILLLSLQLVYMLVASFDAGISADEFRHYEQAGKVYNYYASGGKDKSALESTGLDPMQYNGQAFDNLMYVAERLFGVDNYMEMRHFFNALAGWLIILVTGLIVKELLDYRAALFAAVILFLSPGFIGHALNNNKDIPFAFGFMLSFLGMVLFLKQLPKPHRTSIAILVLGIAGAISIRMAGLLSICFLGLYSFIYFMGADPVKSPFAKSKILLLKKIIIYIIPVSVAGYFLGILFWPFMLEAPFKNLREVLNAMSSHPIVINQLFDGEIYQSNNLPWYYTIRYILITYPSVVLAGSLLFIVLIFKFRKQYKFRQVFMVFFSFVFVVGWMTFKNSNVYGGIRHLLFIYPLAVILCTYGFAMLFELVNNYGNPYLKYAFYGILLLLIVHPLRHLVISYPYAYVYFNEMAGGVKKAWVNYETDYFQHSLKHASEWLIKNELQNKSRTDTARVRIITNDASNAGYYFRTLQDRVSIGYSRYYEKCEKDWDYAIFYNSYIAPSHLKNKQWPPYGTIHTEKVGNAVIASVIKRPSYEDFRGFRFLEKQEADSAIACFENYLKNQPEEDEVLAGISRAYLLKKEYGKAVEFADSALSNYPEYIPAMLFKAMALNETKDYAGAFALTRKMQDIKSDFPETFYQKAVAHYGLGYPGEAVSDLQEAITLKDDYYDAYMYLGYILMTQKQYGQAIEKIYSKVLGFRENDYLAQVKTAQCYYLMKNFSKAEEMFYELGKNYPTNFEVVKLACRICIDRNNLQEAYNFLMMMRHIDDNSDLSVIRALFLLRVNNFTDAKAYLEKAVSENKNNLEAVQLLQSLTEPASTESVMKKQPPAANQINILNLNQ